MVGLEGNKEKKIRKIKKIAKKKTLLLLVFTQLGVEHEHIIYLILTQTFSPGHGIVCSNKVRPREDPPSYGTVFGYIQYLQHREKLVSNHSQVKKVVGSHVQDTNLAA